MSSTSFEHIKLQKLMEDFYIPTHCRNSLAGFILNHIPVGSFLQNLLSNNLKETYTSADDINYQAIGNYIKFLYNCAPSACWGSTEKYLNWIKKGDQNGTP